MEVPHAPRINRPPLAESPSPHNGRGGGDGGHPAHLPFRAEPGRKADEEGPGDGVVGPSALIAETAPPRTAAWSCRPTPVRDKLGFDIYRLSLYLPEPRLDYAYIASPEVAKVFQVDILYGGDLPDEVPDDWQAELVPATSGDEHGAPARTPMRRWARGT